MTPIDYNSIANNVFKCKYIDPSSMTVGLGESNMALLNSINNSTLPAISGSEGYLFGPALKTAEDVASLAGEEATKHIPTLIANVLDHSEQIASANRNLISLDIAVGKVSSKAGLAIGLGLAAVAFGGYLYYKHKDHEIRISTLQDAVAKMTTKIEMKGV